MTIQEIYDELKDHYDLDDEDDSYDDSSDFGVVDIDYTTQS